MTDSDSRMGVIFDLDGVLVDTGWVHKQSWYDLAEKEGFSMTYGFFYSTFGMQNYQIIPMLIGRDASSSEVGRLSNWKERRYRELIADKLACRGHLARDPRAGRPRHEQNHCFAI